MHIHKVSCVYRIAMTSHLMNMHRRLAPYMALILRYDNENNKSNRIQHIAKRTRITLEQRSVNAAKVFTMVVYP